MPAVKPWLAHYDPDVAHTVAPYPHTTLLDSLRDLARNEPDNPVLLFKGARMSYRTLEESSDNSFSKRC